MGKFKLDKSRLFWALAAFAALIIAMNFALAEEEQVGEGEGQELRASLLGLMSLKEEMLSEGIGVERISDLISEGYIYFNSQNYNKTRETILLGHKTRDAAFSAKERLKAAREMHAEANKKNISLLSALSTSPSSISTIEWEINYSLEEFGKENFEEALATADGIIKTILGSISARYSYLNNSIDELNARAGLLGISQYRITSLKELLAQALEAGKLEELDMIEKEITSINTSISSYEEVKLSVQELESRNLSAQRITDGLAEAKAKISIADYASSIDQLEILKSMIRKALKLKDDENLLSESLSEAKASMQAEWSETGQLLQKAAHELRAGNYEEAETHLEMARQSFENTKANFFIESAAKKNPLFSMKGFVAKNWAYIAAAIVILALVLKLTHNEWSRRLMKKRLESLEKELKVSEKMIQELQRNYFVHRKMSRENYDEVYGAMQDRIISMKEKISLLRKKSEKKGEGSKKKGKS